MSEGAPAPEPSSGLLAPGQYHGQGRFELKRLLGEGGMGQVWLARDQRLNEEVALKFLPPAIRNDAVALDDMRRETLKSRKLSHPNIVRIHDLFEGEGELPFISMEFVDGANLAALRVEQPDRCFSWDYLKPLVKQLCDALDYAHGEGVIHRDLKPGNIMLDQKGRLKLADFGIAAVISESSTRVSARLLTAGTLAYMSPQHLRGDMPNASDDIYALGATLYELLTSKPPYFTGDIRHQIESVPVKPLAERMWELSLENPVPADVSALILACLAKEVSQRPQNARAVAEWIGLTTTRTRHAWVEEAAPSTSPATTHVAEAQVIEPVARQKPARSVLLVSVIVAVLALGAGGVWFFKHKGTSETDVAEVDAPEPTIATNDVPEEAATKEVETKSSGYIGGGRLDPAFKPGLGANDWIQSAILQPDGKIIVAGRFTEFNGRVRNRIARLNADGSVDDAFNPGAGPDKDISYAVLQPDGKVLIAGPFDKFGDASRRGIARLNKDGSLDTSFDPGSGADKAGRRLLLQADGKIILAGFFTRFNGENRNRLVRLLPDGSSDKEFNASGGPNDSVLALCQASDGRIWIGGEFTKVSGKDATHLAVLSTNGTLIEGGRAEGPVMELLASPDGKVMAGGNFNRIGDGEQKNLAKLKTPVTLERSYKVSEGFDGMVRCLVSLPNGGVLAGGEFTTADGQPSRGLARLNANGGLNKTLVSQLGGNGTVRALLVQPDGGVIVAGDFTVPGSSTPVRIARILGAAPAAGKVLLTRSVVLPPASGWRDTGFDMQKGALYEVVILGTLTFSDGMEIGANGLLTQPFKVDLGPQGKKGNNEDFPAGCLIGTIGESKVVFFVGTHLRLIAPATGHLRLRVNANPGEPLRATGQFDLTLRQLTDLPMADPDGRYEIAAKIDSSDELHIGARNVHWVHIGGGALVGRHNKGNFPTIINEVCWWPEWTKKSSAPQSVGGLLPMNANLKVIEKFNSRGQCTIAKQSPGETVVRFDDSGLGARTMRVILGPDR